MGKKNILISVDDVTPKNINNVIYIISELEKFGIYKLNLAVVPNNGEKEDISLSNGVIRLVTQQKNLGSDIIMHGYSHTMHKPTGWGPKHVLFGKIIGREEAEFLNLNGDESAYLLDKGLKIFHNIGVNPDGFLPPVWATSHAAKREILRRVRYCIYFNKIQYNWHSVGHKIIPFQSDYPADKLVRLWANIFSRMPYKNLTISLHPQNVHLGTQFEFALKIIKDLAKGNNCNFTTYSRL